MTMYKEEPLPCKNCGEIPEVEYEDSGWSNGPLYHLACPTFHCSNRILFSKRTEEEVIQAWNTANKVEEEPLPCPFCGEKPIIERIVSPGWMITCCSQKCLMADVTCYGSTPTEATAVWNRRV